LEGKVNEMIYDDAVCSGGMYLDDVYRIISYRSVRRSANGNAERGGLIAPVQHQGVLSPPHPPPGWPRG
jgi:hypothetical protein